MRLPGVLSVRLAVCCAPCFDTRGSPDNVVTPGVHSATIAGGGRSIGGGLAT